MPTIETLEDWNDRLACCCKMPLCPEPSRECEAVEVQVEPDSQDYAEGVFYKTRRDVGNRTGVGDTTELYDGYKIAPGGGDVTGPEYVRYEKTTVDSRLILRGKEYPFIVSRCGNVEISDLEVIRSGSLDVSEITRDGRGDVIGEGPDINFYTFISRDYSSSQFVDLACFNGWRTSWTETTRSITGWIPPWVIGAPVTTNGSACSTADNFDTSYIDPFMEDEMTNEARSLVALMEYSSCPTNDCTANLTEFKAFPTFWIATARKSRFRWVIPDTFPGTYFLVTWDVAFFPADDPENPVPVALDQTWVWPGPGDPEDADSWKSGWYELNPPEAPGQVRVVNVRFICYRATPYGPPPPQVTGEGIDWPDP